MPDSPKTAVAYLVWHKYPGDTLDTHPSIFTGAPGHDRYYPSWPLHLPTDRELQWQFDTDDPNRCIEGHYKEILDMIEAGVDCVLVDWWCMPSDSTDAVRYPTLNATESPIYQGFSAVALRYFMLALEKAEREGRAIPKVAPFVEYHCVQGDFGAALGTEILAKGNFTTTPADTWDVTGNFDGAFTGGKAVYAHSTGLGQLIQTHAKMSAPTLAYANRPYKFTYTISAPTVGCTATIVHGFASQAVSLDLTVGTHSVCFWSDSTAATASFTISVTSTAGGFSMDDVTLKQLPEAYDWFVETSRRFYTMVPERYLATIDDKILWWTWWFTQSKTTEVNGIQIAPGNIAEVFRSAFNAAYPTYPELYMVADMDYRDESIGYQWWPEYKPGGLDAVAEWAVRDVESIARITGQVRSAFPGFDRHAQHDGITGISSRNGTDRFEYALQQALKLVTGVKLIRTMWNDFEESDWICRSREGDNDCMLLLKEYGDRLKAGVNAPTTLSKPMPEWIASRPTMVGSYSLGHRWISGRIGKTAFRTGDYAVGADGRIYWGIRNHIITTDFTVGYADWVAADMTNVDLTATVYADNSRLPFTGGVVCIDNEWILYDSISSNGATMTINASGRGYYGSTAAAHTALPINTVAKKMRRAVVNANGWGFDMEPPILPPWQNLPAAPDRPYTNRGVDTNLRFDLADAFTWGDMNPTLNIDVLYFDAVYRGYALIGTELSSVATSVIMDSNAQFPVGSGLLMIGTELIGYVGISSTTTLTGLKRGLAQTTAAVHTVGTPVRQVLGRCALLGTYNNAEPSTFPLAAGHGAFVKQYDYLRIDEDATHWEIVQVASISTDTLTVTRAIGGMNGTNVIANGANALSTLTAAGVLHTATTVTAGGGTLAITSLAKVGPYVQLQYGFQGFDGLYNITGAYKTHATSLAPDTSVVWDRSVNGADILQASVAATTLSAATISSGIRLATIGTADGVLPILNNTAFPSSGTVFITNGTNDEYCTYTGKSVDTFELTGVKRGQFGSTPYSFTDSESVSLIVLEPDETTITVASTTGFPSSGLLLITDASGTEYVRYTGKTVTTFTGCTRGFGSHLSAARVEFGYGTARPWGGATDVKRSLWQLAEWPLIDANLESLQDYSTDILLLVKGDMSIYAMDVFAILPYEVGPDPNKWNKQPVLTWGKGAQ